MGNSSKPRKKRNPERTAQIPRIVNIQMTKDEHPDLAMKLHAALVTLIQRLSISSCNNMSHELCCIAGGMSHALRGAPLLHRKDADTIALKSALLALESIIARCDRTAYLTVNEHEEKTLLAAAARLDGALGKIPYTCYKLAQAEVIAATKPKQEAA